MKGYEGWVTWDHNHGRESDLELQIQELVDKTLVFSGRKCKYNLCFGTVYTRVNYLWAVKVSRLQFTNVWGLHEGVEDKNADDDEEADINIELRFEGIWNVKF